ncbi:HAMP domain-containing histidine kinase [Pyxidicoccus fallax]|uniref:histidine kinase n=1 Tax=Pyxidicoccus fallax TaxID=394095 RepID=A0A848LFT5_9BACT|nr:HAMP domain-containing sensor histidine kinase [Pyxidicoccus fallax]NMO17384.1 HAMP domain-containing histidine kinase [Pyxidicoccus fallax]NPC77917.1 HAMP domain-containing histidine kinase [Pyxidicoccus fallax]
MGPLFAYSLVPVLSVALLLCFTAALRGRNARGLALYCLATAVWSGALLLICFPRTAWVGERFAASGAFISATYLHAAYDVTRQRSYRLVALAYAVAVVVTSLGLFFPSVLYGPVALRRGPLFWPAMVLAVAAAAVPLAHLARSYRHEAPERRPVLRGLGIAGALAYSGTIGNALLLSSGYAVPFGMYLVLAALLVLAHVLNAYLAPGERRLMERSLVYSAMAAVLSAGFLFGVLTLMAGSGQPFLAEYRAGAFFLLALAALAFEPVRQGLQEWLGRRFLKGRATGSELAAALAVQEARADQAARLAELGQLTAAVAHEVRNPLGVLAAHLKLLERRGGDPESLAAMREQIERASHFVDELLRYGRPRPLDLRRVDVPATLALSYSTARQGLGALAPEVTFEPPASESLEMEADQAQLSQVFVILFENSLLALRDVPSPRLRVQCARDGQVLRVRVEDSGPGIPAELLPRLFQPFVTGRKREGPRPGTGLGLAIARGIVERHGGNIRADRSEALGGALFEVEMPLIQPASLAAAVS